MSSINCRDLPIGVFDSGFGGLSAVREIQRILPFEDITYFGDTARVPYGTKSVETLRKYASQDVAFLIEKGVKAIVIACGTARYEDGRDTSVSSVFERADKAMYENKNRLKASREEWE